MINRKFLMFIVYVFGFLTPFLVIGILTILGVEPSKSKAEVALSKWTIKECNDTFLLINIQSEPNIWFSVGVNRDPNTRFLQKVGVVREQEKQAGSLEALFVYESKGIYDIPIACYGSSGLLWRDLNFDGRFDQLIDYKNKEMAINIDAKWVHGMGKTDAVNTEKGIFRFDPNAGEWKMITARSQ